MSTRSELETLVRLAPEVDATALSDANLRLLLDKATIDLALKGRALPRNEKVNTVASQQEYVVSGASAVVTANDFLAIDTQEGGVQFYDGSRWVAEPDFRAVTKKWLDLNHPGWRTNDAASVPLYWYLGTKADNNVDLVIGLVDKPSASTTDGLWIHWLGRGVLMTAGTHYPWTGSTTQLVHLEPYEILLVYWVLDYYNRLIAKNDADADKYRLLYESGAKAMASRMPLSEHLLDQPFLTPPYFQRFHPFSNRRF